jgi:hypothetical protein
MGRADHARAGDRSAASSIARAVPARRRRRSRLFDCPRSRAIPFTLPGGPHARRPVVCRRARAFATLGASGRPFWWRCIEGHWSFSAFCFTRKWFGVRFELTVLLLTEIVSTVYYRLLRRYCDDKAVRAMCRLILRDEAGHVAFHRDRLARGACGSDIYEGRLWRFVFRLLGFGAGTMLYLNHGCCLRTVGATTAEFYREVWQEESRFLRRLQSDAQSPPA